MTIAKLSFYCIKEITSYVKDAKDFIQTLNQIEKVPEDSLLVTLDVKSLYTHIPNNEGIKTVKEAFYKKHPNKTISRSSHQRRSMEKGVLKNFTKFTGNSCARASFSNKVAGLRPSTLLKKRICHRCLFSCEFCEISKNTLFTEHLWATASAFRQSLILTLNNFIFNSVNYMQKMGCATRTVCTPSYANLLMGQFENIYIYIYLYIYIYPFIKVMSLLFLRYIDGIFIIWKGTKEQLITLIN